jgi:hypothetical protein
VPPTAAAVQPAAVTPTAPVAPPPSKPADEMLTVTITSDPPGAEVLRGGTSIGETPQNIQVKKGAPSFDIEVKKAGFASQKRTITTERSRDLEFALAKEEATPVVAKKASSHGKKAAGKTATSGDDMQLMTPKF